ncbi:hypothetical protein AZE42_04055 [Rhizopogon vesiculosus]|uniref:Uncharacterized protein n=1 Tax=Rhizopogon vesiculosus TaxID=180088 RepID=A0A1J8QE15_9AGAM|nr:hypothetical protein AZE42_04055 [Rhizopogon vesiculosus]
MYINPRVDKMTDQGHVTIEAWQHSYPPLDEREYNPRPQDIVFMKKLIGIEDDAALKRHILDVQAKAYKEDKQLHMAHALAGLLSPEPGSVILGAHTGAQEKGVVNQVFRNVEVDMFSHSPESWIAMWDGEVFKKGMVKVEAELREVISDVSSGERYPFLFWSVTRL